MSIRIYRHRDQIKVTPPEGPTFHLGYDEARLVAQSLMTFCEDVKRCQFPDSVEPMHEIEIK